MPRQITYADIDKLLLELGFQMASVRGSHRVFRHPETKSTVVLPYRPGKRSIDQVHIAAVRRILDQSGLLDREDFYRWLAK